MGVERSELRLVWPVDLFVGEARALMAAFDDSLDGLGFVMAEAFHGGLGWQLFEQEPQVWFGGQKVPAAISARTQLVRALIADKAGLRPYVQPLLYSQRLDQTASRSTSKEQTLLAFARLVHELAAGGYFTDAFGSCCVDADDDPDAEAQRRIAITLDVTNQQLWPGRCDSQSEMALALTTWSGSRNLFYDLVEALDLFVARPRRRSRHDHGREWDYSDFTRAPGQRLYRWRVNRILERADPADFDVRMAEHGEDQGRLVQVTGDARDELVVRVLVSALDAVDERRHAIALFRARDAGIPEKRSAITTLARLLEHRRKRMPELGIQSNDVGPLFNIANNFDLRHKDGKQYAGYSPAFLDWIFWWYLATLELTDRLIAEQAPSGGSLDYLPRVGRFRWSADAPLVPTGPPPTRLDSRGPA